MSDRYADAVPSPAPDTPTRTWQSLVPQLPPLAGSADTAERLLLLLHYGIDWESSWVGDPKHRETYWDEALPGRVRRAAYRADTLDRWWSEVSGALGAPAPRQRDRRLELAVLLSEPSLPVIDELRHTLAARILRVRIIAEAVKDQRTQGRS